MNDVHVPPVSTYCARSDHRGCSGLLFDETDGLAGCRCECHAILEQRRRAWSDVMQKAQIAADRDRFGEKRAAAAAAASRRSTRPTNR
jgi:hypothetical protein